MSLLRGYLFGLSKKTGFNRFLSYLITKVYGDPSTKLKLIGVTGTNGKTTTAFLIHKAIENMGGKAGLIGTLYAYVEPEIYTSLYTTPQPLTLNRLLVKMVKKNFNYCILETSSIGLAENRVDGLKFEAGVFTNLKHDHLNFHGSWEAYGSAKSILFESLTESSLAILNKDDPYCDTLIKCTKAKVILYGDEQNEENAPTNSTGITEITFSIVSDTMEGLTLNLDGFLQHFKLVGHFNAYNIAAAYTTLIAQGFDKKKTIEALSLISAPPGRFQIVNKFKDKNQPLVIVDYAHTPDALEKVLNAAKKNLAKDGDLIVVFGCGGERDKTKRPIMGHIAEKFTTKIILTSDNSRNEKTIDICRDIAKGIKDNNIYLIEEERKQAIRNAIQKADPDSIIIIAGKGHETHQEVNGKMYYHSDTECAKNELKMYEKKSRSVN